jgi:putative peptidoglycan lipid II flippase
MAVAATSKGLGFFREILIANYYGASGLVDAFSVAYSVPLLAAGGISFAFSMALLPRYHHVLAAKGKEAANCLLVSVNASCLVLSIVVMLPLWVMPDEVIHLAAPGLPPDGARLAGDLLRWLCLYVLTLNMVNLLVTTFHAFNHFKVPAFSEVAFNAVTILVLVGWASSLGIHALVLGNLLGNALCIGLLVGALTRNRAGLGRWYFRLLDLLSPVRLMIPIWGYALCGHMGVIIANYFASGLGEGSVAALGYARTASVAVVTLVTLNLARGMFPTLAALSAAEKRHEGRTLLLGLSRVITFVFVPASVLLVVFRKELLGILYLRGAFSAVDLETTSTVFLYFTATLVVAALEPVFVRTCFTFADSRTPLMTTLAGAVVMIPLMMVLTPQMGIAGIGLSAGLALLVDVSIQVLVIDRKFGGLFAGELIKCLARSTVYAAVALPLLLLWPAEGSIQALISAIVYVGGYYSIARYFSDDGVRALWLLWKKGTVSTG